MTAHPSLQNTPILVRPSSVARGRLGQLLLLSSTMSVTTIPIHTGFWVLQTGSSLLSSIEKVVSAALSVCDHRGVGQQSDSILVTWEAGVLPWFLHSHLCVHMQHPLRRV